MKSQKSVIFRQKISALLTPRVRGWGCGSASRLSAAGKKTKYEVEIRVPASQKRREGQGDVGNLFPTAEWVGRYFLILFGVF